MEWSNKGIIPPLTREHHLIEGDYMASYKRSTTVMYQHQEYLEAIVGTVVLRSMMKARRLLPDCTNSLMSRIARTVPNVVLSILC